MIARTLNLFVFFFIAWPALTATAQDTTRVLFIGNSFTYYHNMPQMVQQLAGAANRPLIYAMHAPGGISVGDTVQGTAAHMNNPVVYQNIRAQEWDFVVIQDNQGRFIRDYGQFPSSSLVVEGHLKLRDSVMFHHPCAQIIWFSGWAFKNGYLPYSPTGIGLIERISANYSFLKDTAGHRIAPIGAAWKDIVEHAPSIELWAADDAHSSTEGSYLTACVIYASIFYSNPLRSSFNPGIGTTEDSLLKTAAYNAVNDSAGMSGLAAGTPVIVVAGNQLSLTGFENADWYRNDSLIASGPLSITASVNGLYHAIATDANGCMRTSAPVLIQQATGLPEEELPEILAFPVPAEDVVHLSGERQAELLVITDIHGKICFRKTAPLLIESIRTDGLQPGIYHATLTYADKTQAHARIIIN